MAALKLASHADHVAQLEALATTARSETVRQQALKTLLDYRIRTAGARSDHYEDRWQILLDYMTSEEREVVAGVLNACKERKDAA